MSRGLCLCTKIVTGLLVQRGRREGQITNALGMKSCNVQTQNRWAMLALWDENISWHRMYLEILQMVVVKHIFFIDVKCGRGVCRRHIGRRTEGRGNTVN